ncbi:MAG: 6-pyruvoyl-tetrahydropterin synthase-related protein [Anaerolineae bacterium]|nr:6-pyruvoyl-tetrahydropterin synthase-related protein [Anaerolineae bacterium]MDW8173992.1 6-pyruvoyl-tetrahydropterin synthase-related protein [Anaerolineae bacterium]
MHSRCPVFIQRTTWYSPRWFGQIINKSRTIIVAVLLALTAAPLLGTLIGQGLVLSGDGEVHLMRLLTMHIHLENSVLWPRWTPFIHFGFGSPLFNYYPPLWYMLGALLSSTGLGAVGAMKTLLGLSAVGLVVGAYLWGRTMFSRAGALALATVYVLAPMRPYELLLQVNAPQWAAQALIPWLLWAMSRASSGTRRWTMLAALLWAGLICMHHISAFLAAPLIFIWATWLVFRSNARQRDALRLLMVLILGAGVAAIFWLPALAEMPLVRLGQADAMFQPQNNLLALEVLLGGSDTSGKSWQQSAAFQPRIGHIQLVALMLGTVLAWRQRWRGLALGMLMGAGWLIFLMMPLSAELWMDLPFVGLIQFPWRLLNVVVVLCALGAGLAVESLPSRARMGALLVLWLFAHLLLAPMWHVPVERREPPALTPADILAYELNTGHLGLTPADDYLPRTAQVRPQFGLYTERRLSYVARSWRVDVDQETLPEGLYFSPAGAHGARLDYDMTVPKETDLRLLQLAFPGWRVWADGVEVPVKPDKPHGLMTIALPSGAQKLTVAYEGTCTQHLAALLSLASLAALLLVARANPSARW